MIVYTNVMYLFAAQEPFRLFSMLKTLFFSGFFDE